MHAIGIWNPSLHVVLYFSVESEEKETLFMLAFF